MARFRHGSSRSTPRSSRTARRFNPSSSTAKFSLRGSPVYRRSSLASSSMSMSRRSSLLSSKRSYTGRMLDKGDGSNVTATWSKKSGRKVMKEGRPKKKVKVSKSLRGKINKVLEKEAGNGWYKQIQYAGPFTPIDNDQLVFYPSSNGQAFTPTDVLQAAGVLFNGYNPAGPIGNFTTTGFVAPTFKVTVIDSSAVYRFKNNTARTLTLKVWDVSPKSANTDSLGLTPIEQWNANLAAERPDFLDATNSGVNPLSNLSSTLTMHPQSSPSFMKAFSVDETVVTLEAGKEYNHKLSGPKAKVYDYSKFIVNGTMSDYQKMNKYTFCAVYVDLATTDPGTLVGRWTDITATDGFGLLCEATHFYRLSLPEQAGLVIPTLPVAGSSIGLTNRKSNVSAIKVFNTVQGAVPVVVVQDEQPTEPQPTAPGPI